MEAPVPLATAAKSGVLLELAGLLFLVATIASGLPPILEVAGLITVFFGLSIGATVWGVHAQKSPRPLHMRGLLAMTVAGAIIGSVGFASLFMSRSGERSLYLVAGGFGAVGLWLLFQARSPIGLGLKAGIAGTIAGLGMLLAGSGAVWTFYNAIEEDSFLTPVGFILTLLSYPIWAWNVGRAAAQPPAPSV